MLATAVAVSSARDRSLENTAFRGSPASCSARTRAWSTPAALSGMSVCPWTRRPIFQSVSPCRASRISVIRQPYRGRLTLAGAHRAGDRAPSARRRRPGRRLARDRGRRQPRARRGAVGNVGHLADAGARCLPRRRRRCAARPARRDPSADHPDQRLRGPAARARGAGALCRRRHRRSRARAAARQRLRRLGRAARRAGAHGRRHARTEAPGSPAWISGSPAKSRS